MRKVCVICCGRPGPFEVVFLFFVGRDFATQSKASKSGACKHDIDIVSAPLASLILQSKQENAFRNGEVSVSRHAHPS